MTCFLFGAMEKVGQWYPVRSIDNAYLDSALFYMNFWGHVVKNNSIIHQWWIRECKGLADKFYLAFLKKKKKSERDIILVMKRSSSYRIPFTLNLSRIASVCQFFTPRLYCQIGHIWVLNSYLKASYILASK